MDSLTMTPEMAAQYLSRIGFPMNRKTLPTGASLPAPTADNLYLLQERHLCSVPYETIDIYDRIPFTLETGSVFDKIVRRRRGGYCFELNGLFAVLLRSLGYGVTEYFARFLRDAYVPGEHMELPMRRHRVLRVVAEGENFLCDVGVGGVCPTHPLRLTEGLEQTDDGGEHYRIDRDPFLGYVVMEQKGSRFLPYYSFTEEPQLPVDFVAVNYYCQHSPDVAFTQKPMASLKNQNGRVTLSGFDFKRFTPSGVEVRTAADDAEFRTLLAEYFGITG